jgi:hypothetical protein
MLSRPFAAALSGKLKRLNALYRRRPREQASTNLLRVSRGQEGLLTSCGAVSSSYPLTRPVIGRGGH